jgi:ATP-dependent helicase/nuclease subunit A
MEHGTDIHRQLQHLSLSDGGELAARIGADSNIARFWGAGSRAEVPLAGWIGGDFYSMRIDRMLETPDAVLFLDYKTDEAKGRRDEYVQKMRKYAALLSRIFPGKKIIGSILWLRDWKLDEI